MGNETFYGDGLTSFARVRQNTCENKQILNLANYSMKDIRIYYKGRNYT